jgi:triphosphatase
MKRGKEAVGTDHLEIEWQFEADDLGAVERWLEASPDGHQVSPGATHRIRDTYLDTGDWRLHRAGYALRVRRAGRKVEATMKAISSGSDGPRRRREISEPLKRDTSPEEAPGPVGERLRALLGGRELAPLFTVRTRRKEFEVRPEVGEDGLIGPYQVALDESEIQAGGGRGEPVVLRRVEVEARESAVAEGFVGSMRTELELPLTELSKFESGLRASRAVPEGLPEPGSTEVCASQGTDEVAFAVLRRHFSAMLSCELGTRLGEDLEELHDMRVATRRLRTALKAFRDFLPARAGRYERDLKYVADALGKVRDLDVQLQSLAVENEEAPGLAEALRERREESRTAMIRVLDSKRYQKLVSDFAGTIRRGRGPSPRVPITEAAPEIVRRRCKSVRKAASRLDEGSPPEEYHDLRKKGRRMRYTLEFLREIYGKPFEKEISTLKSVQDVLGEHQDLVVAGDVLRQLVSEVPDLSREAAFALGTRAERHRSQAEETRGRLRGLKEFEALRKGRPWKKLEKAMSRVTEKAG